MRAGILSGLFTPAIVKEGLTEKVKFDQRSEEEASTTSTNMLRSNTCV